MEIVKKTFEKLGFKILYLNEKETANGVDMWVIKENGQPMSVEIKKIKKNGNRYQCPPVEKNRRQDDFIAIVLNNNYCFIEQMSDHLKCCSVKGYRPFTKICGSSSKQGKYS